MSETSNYKDLRDAIEATAYVRKSSGARIISRGAGTGSWIFDFRALLLQPQWMNRFAEIFWEHNAKHYPFQICGMESAGIALVAAIVMKGVERGTPVNGLYIRKSRKRDGLMKFIEGTPTKDPVILIDDLANSGQTLNKQVTIIKEAGLTVSDIFVLLAFRGPDAYRFADDAGIRFKTIFRIDEFGLALMTTIAPEIPKQSFETVWRFTPPNPSYEFVIQKSIPVLDKGRLFYGTDSGVFYALDARDGSEKWRFTTGKHPEGKGIFSSPALHKDTVYFGAYDGNVYALNTETGAVRWKFDDADWIGSSPSLAPDLGLLFVGLEYGLFMKAGGIAAINMKDGTTAWKKKTTQHTHASPLYIPEESIVVVGSNDGCLYAYDAATGTERWRFASAGDFKTTSAYDKKRKRIIAVSMDGNAYVLDAKTGVPVFAHETGAGMYSIPLVTDDTIYLSSLDKCVYALDADTGKKLWAFPTRGRVFSSPRIFEGSLWVGSNDGCMYELSPASGTLLSFFQASERIIGAALCDPSTHRIFVTTVANEIYCISRKASS